MTHTLLTPMLSDIEKNYITHPISTNTCHCQYGGNFSCGDMSRNSSKCTTTILYVKPTSCIHIACLPWCSKILQHLQWQSTARTDARFYERRRLSNFHRYGAILLQYLSGKVNINLYHFSAVMLTDMISCGERVLSDNWVCLWYLFTSNEFISNAFSNATIAL